ncbi:MAG: leucine--tRNA ligase [Peptoniphilaceae bacterium]|nr:leucine--tRNA ligase [Peptoniphilaceae bacterium]MDD7383590.1 leucine--tRNA ligase [Peptoniphilaceae bacterium]MDY3738762.1 leucine--tRNA ligase [Peptoniphilaceae bacterium]
MREYNPNKIEKKWQKYWYENKTFKALEDFSLPKYYALIEFPYPSGQGLHVGHPRPYTAMDIIARKRRLEGYNVLFPIGWDAFGLPTENYAIKNHVHPAKVTEKNIARFKEQMKSIGFSFDWDREVNTTDPNYYKWTQWIFLQLYKHGLAYKKNVPVNWCPHDKVVLANEEVVDGKCERCGTEVVRRNHTQWMLKITEYADRLIDDLKDLDFEDRIVAQQVNWIGRSFGANIDFKISGKDDKLTVYTTRPDTIFGATYMVIAPEHDLIENYKDDIKNIEEVRIYQQKANKKSELERSELNKEKTGVKLEGICAVNPFTEKEIPIWISDYVLTSYGTGAIMAVPAHDTRDYEFASKFNMPIVKVIENGDESIPSIATNKGKMINSGFLNGLSIEDAKKKIIDEVTKRNIGKATKNFKLRDWVFSRQRYWGEPIPMIYNDKEGWSPLDEKDLPLTLPEVDNYEPTDDGKSPLSKMTQWLDTTSKSGIKSLRETDTMPQWAGSSWYFMRYTDPNNKNFLASKEDLNYWLPVDWYNGGMEHTTLHLLYSRFWYKFLYDIGVAPTKEPYKKRTSHGMILGSDHQKMSKSRGNVVNPDDIVRDYGADTLRTYEMFIGDFEQAAPWSETGVKGIRRYLERVYNLYDLLQDDVNDNYSKELEIKINQTIKKVSDDFENLKFNTAISALMELLNEMRSLGHITKKDLQTYLILLNPVAPHITEEMWQEAGFDGYLHETKWPEVDESKLHFDKYKMAVQINGKVRATIDLDKDADQEDAVEEAENQENIKKYIEGKEIVKVIFVPKKILNFVIK